MDRRSRIVSLAVALCLSTVVVCAQEAPKPAPELSQIAFFEGSWSCTGKMNESPFGPAGSMTSTADVKKDLGGFFQSGVIKGSMPKMPPFEGRFHVTYNPAAKQFVMFWVDSMGGWAMNTSPGWKGDVMVYEGDSHMGAQSFRSRDTFTRGAGTMKHAWEAQVGGKWMPIGEESCKKK
jgi:hypothetical protein